MPKGILKLIETVEGETRNNKKHILSIALDYGGRNEIVRAVKKMVDDNIPSKKIDEKLLSSYLDTAGQPYPNPDLFIRTSGEQRTSGFMPWQSVYSEYYWEPDHLPDFSTEKLKNIILDYSRRRRRFGSDDALEHFVFKPELAANLELSWWRLRNIPEGKRFRDYAVEHVREQYGLSRKLAKEAVVYMGQALLERREGRFKKAAFSMGKFYKLLKDELKLAFEPSLVASLEVRLWRELGESENIESASDGEVTARELYAEVYRISLFQAAKLAHLRVLATVERNLAEKGFGEDHWERAEDYLEKFYSALKERVA